MRNKTLQNTWLYNKLFKLKLAKRDFDAKPQRLAQKKEAIDLLDKMSHFPKRIFVCGNPMHKNMGDQAQAYLILQWCEKNYPDYTVINLPTWPFYERDFQERMKKEVREEDIIVIQSGYCTSERHYDHKMHRFLVSSFPNVPILFMPQTVNFFDESEGYKTGKIYKKHPRLLFLARDKKSYESAQKYFGKALLYPDIVTSLIGQKKTEGKRDGILMCIRNDTEKKYSAEEIDSLYQKFKIDGYRCTLSDTNSDLPLKELQLRFPQELQKLIEEFASYQVVITDRYHGTIFSMIANTPVIVLATNDHKVKTGTEWFKGVYDGNFYNADSLGEARMLALKLISKNKSIKNPPYFQEKYYETLKEKFEKVRNSNG